MRLEPALVAALRFCLTSGLSQMQTASMQLTLRYENKAQRDLIKRAATAERRSMNGFILYASVEAAKATLAMKKGDVFAPSAANSESKSA